MRAQSSMSRLAAIVTAPVVSGTRVAISHARVPPPLSGHVIACRANVALAATGLAPAAAFVRGWIRDSIFRFAAA
jgi:hypothetical protein